MKKINLLLISIFLFLSCEKTQGFENRAYFIENTLILELNYKDLPTKDNLQTIFDTRIIFENLKQTIVSPLDEEGLITIEQNEEFFRVQFFNLDSIPQRIIFLYRPRKSFMINLNSDDPNNIQISIR